MRRPRWRALAAALAMVAACASCGGAHGTHGAAPAPARPQGGSSAAGRGGSGSVCGLDGFAASGAPDAAPPADAWRYEAASVWPWPYSKRLGPGTIAADGMRSCFAHTPEGALFAAANIAAMMTDTTLMAEPAHRLALFARGSRYRRLADALGASRSGAGARATDTRASMAGFRMLEYTAGRAMVDLAYETSSGALSVDMSFVYHLVWSGGDWKLRAESEPPMTSAPIPSLSGYIEWRQ